MSDKTIYEVVEDLQKKVDRKPTMWDFLFILLLVCKVMDIGSPESLKALTWWHVFLLPYGASIVLAALGWFIVAFDVAQRLGFAVYKVGAWFRRRKEKRAA